MRFFEKFRYLIVRFRVYMMRAGSYISLVNTAMILFLFLSNLEKYGIDVDIKDWIIPLFMVGILGMVLFGYIEDKLGFYAEEQKTTQMRSPVFNEIISRLDRIEKKLKK